LRLPHLCNDHARTVVDVGSCKPQEPKTGVDEQVLAAVVLDETIAVVATVVLDD